MIRVVLLHGNGNGHGTDNWFPYIKSELEKINVHCEAPDLPDSVLARSKYWLPYFKNVLKLDENDILVGHSTGSLAAMRYAEDNIVGGTVLVGVYDTDLGDEDEKASGYFDTPWQWDKIKAHQKWTAIFASTDDPYIPIEQPRFIRDQLDSIYFEFTNKGHFSGHAPSELKFPELLKFLKEKLQK